MAWRSSGRTNAQLIGNLATNGIVHSERVMRAMKSVDRANYVPSWEEAYEDSPQPIGYGATISAPHMHAYASEHLLPYLKQGSRVLDVGSGSGYLVAVLHELVKPGGTVVGIDHIPELVENSVENLKKDGRAEALEKGEIIMVAGDGRLGYPTGGPYDTIHVGAAAPTVPQALIDQLARPGRIFIPVGNFLQYVEHIDKDEHGNIHREKVMGVRYVPLTDKESQLEFPF
ncbi:protein-L-isoaspartate O-methyltransferase [Gymnopilus junonius]|uniref:Protein-L-isoaspartate O-methyltransferase n=1 Tax=Gymnopilus junonius TaxID=109634 RepID=A0A9P5NB60_GYMJU|nr:protein-L-isoaspartate O-methyltransferase [Gymnopilus junonius]